MGENRAAVSVAVFSRFAIYANVVSPATVFAKGDVAIVVMQHTSKQISGPYIVCL